MASNASWTFSADGTGEWKILDPRKPLQLSAYGTWGGGTLKLQFSQDDGANFATLKDSSGADVVLSANGAHAPIRMAFNESFRPVLTGSTSPSIVVRLEESL